MYTDLMLGILKKYVLLCSKDPRFTERCLRIRRKRPSLRLIVSSATLDATSFLDYFTADNGPDEAIIVSLEGRMYPVQTAYLAEPAADYVRKAAEVVWNIHLQVGRGNLQPTILSLHHIAARKRRYPSLPHGPRRNRPLSRRSCRDAAPLAP